MWEGGGRKEENGKKGGCVGKGGGGGLEFKMRAVFSANHQKFQIILWVAQLRELEDKSESGPAGS